MRNSVMIKKITIAWILFASVLIYGAIQPNFTADLSGCVFTPIDALNGSYTGSIANGTGEMAGLGTASGSYKSIINSDGTVYVLTNSKSISGRNTFTIRANHLVNLSTGTLSDNVNSPTTYTTVTLVVSKGVNKGKYVSKSAGSSGTTDASNFSLTKMSISGGF